ncbi:MAG: magnesium and cobalt transport protein CorA [Deltaproteobacteria bacterium]|nr:MAG: magnesium and cobalt transport protein CorA [Deltaproteobacteria bacterium]
MKMIQDRSAKIGVQAGTVVHVGEERTGKVVLHRIEYSETGFQEIDIRSLGECAMAEEGRVVWINVDGVHDTNIIEDLGAMFGIDPLMQEDIVNTDQRPKCNIFEDQVYIVMRMMDFDEAEGIVLSEQVSVVMGEGFVLTFLEDPGDLFDPVRERIRKGMGRIRKMGADYLAYSLIDIVVDRYFTVIERVSDRIEEMEDLILVDFNRTDLQQLHEMRSTLLYLRKNILPVRDLLGDLERGDISFTGETFRVYIKDVMEHCVQIADTVETCREMVTSLFDIYISMSNNRMNEVMKVLTMIATIFIPLTFIAGVYGMNFRNMPEIASRYGYPAVLAVMCIIGIGMIFFFRKKKWL